MLIDGLPEDWVGRVLKDSRFGVSRLVTLPSGEVLVAKVYNRPTTPPASWDLPSQFLSLCHPNVMPIRHFIPGCRHNGPVLLTEYFEDGSLEDVLICVRKGRPPSFWSPDTQLAMIHQILAALSFLHSNHIFHGDLKPSDIIVRTDGSILVCGYLTSFLEENGFTDTTTAGTPLYAAPEVLDGAIRSGLADVYSCGLIIFEIWTTQPVFSPGMAAAPVMRAQFSSRPAHRQTLAEFGIPDPWAHVIQRCRAANPGDRLTVNQIIQILDSQGSEMPPVSPVRLKIIPKKDEDGVSRYPWVGHVPGTAKFGDTDYFPEPTSVTSEEGMNKLRT